MSARTHIHPAGIAPSFKSLHFCTVLGVALILLSLARSLPAQETTKGGALRVGVLLSPPFVIAGEVDNTYRGIAMDLWYHIAEELELEAEFQVFPLAELLEKTASGDLDIAIAPLTVTADRELLFDFSHPYFDSGVGIAVPRKSSAGAFEILVALLGNRFLQVTGLVALTLLCGGTLVWVLERRGNTDQYGGQWYSGLGAGIWWAVVTISTVGYGDKVPRTVGGRVMAVILIFAGVMVFSSFTAVITTALTTNALESRSSSAADLAAMRVGTVAASVSEEYLRARGIFPQTFSVLDDALADLAKKNIDAVVADRPLLQYHIAAFYPREFLVLSERIRKEQYAFAFPEGSTLREQVNRILIRSTNTEAWDEIVRRYIGAD